MNLRARDLDVQQDFSQIVDYFIKRYCRVGPDSNISDRTLFHAFRAFWIATAPETQHPALLGQFRVELAERGFRSSGQKRPCWYGLTLHRLTVLSETENERPIVP
jgi:hypothetical protein